MKASSTNKTKPAIGKLSPPMESKKLLRLIHLIEKQYNKLSANTPGISFGLQHKDGAVHVLGNSQPVFTIVLNNEQAVTALGTLDQNTVVEAYLSGSMDIEGNIMGALDLRELFNDEKGFDFLWRFIRPFYLAR